MRLISQYNYRHNASFFTVYCCSADVSTDSDRMLQSLQQLHNPALVPVAVKASSRSVPTYAGVFQRSSNATTQDIPAHSPVSRFQLNSLIKISSSCCCSRPLCLSSSAVTSCECPCNLPCIICFRILRENREI